MYIKNLYVIIVFCEKKIVKTLVISFSIILVASIILIVILLSIRPNKPPVICDNGYFIPINKNKCQKCSVENCAICNGTIDNNECSLCESNYQEIKENGKIISCINGTYPNCGNGYFIPNNGNKCQKCSVENCAICNGTIDINECKTCKEGFKLNKGICQIDYLIKAIYYINNENESVNLITSTNKITKMVIDEKQVNPIKNYTF